MIFALIGPRGAGKTTLAKKLAAELDWQPVFSTDDEVVKAAGKSIAQIVDNDGWQSFRELETRALRTCIEYHDKHVHPGKGVMLDTGGGIVLAEENRRLILDNGFAIYLTANPSKLVSRIVGDPTRPALTDANDALIEMKQILAQRDGLYRELASVDLDTGLLGIEACATILTQWISKRCGTCSL